MVEFINKVTGSIMYVNESRVEEYKAAGHIAASSIIDSTATEVTEEETKPKRTRKVK